MSQKYQLLDCGDRRKIEKYGQYTLIRPCPQAIWKPFDPSLWSNFDSEFVRVAGEKGEWKGKALPKQWEVEGPNKTVFTVEPNEFGNLGVFTEHWIYAVDLGDFLYPDEQILNLFSYSGSSVMGLLKENYKAVAVDSSKGAMALYTQNMKDNQIEKTGQKLILEDAIKFCQREIRRGKDYGSIIADVPSYGRGTKGELFDIGEQFTETLEVIKKLLKKNGRLILTLHSPRYTLEGLRIYLSQLFEGKSIEAEEIIQKCTSGASLPSGMLFKIK